MQGFPLDAGTDNGLTFTSPNWATEPRGEVFRITSQFPQHPAGSFHYPHLDRLPTIAVYTLTKVARQDIVYTWSLLSIIVKRVHTTAERWS